MKKSKIENKIFVIYVGIAGIRSEDVADYVYEIGKRIAPQSVESEIITIPSQSYETRIECINPKYITNNELIRKHSNLIDKLNIELEEQLKILKKENGKKEN